MDKVTERLSSMKGFTKEYWGLRGTVVSLFKGLRHIPVTNLETYLKSKSEIMKGIKTRLQYENGGCYRPEELMYLAHRYHSQKSTLEAFLARLENPESDLAEHFEELYAPVKTTVDACDNEIKANLSSRARILFPQDKKKKSINWAKMSIVEKLSDLDDEKSLVFKPETLPGIDSRATNQTESGSPTYLQARYGDLSDDPHKMSVVLSWYSTFFDS